MKRSFISILILALISCNSSKVTVDNSMYLHQWSLNDAEVLRNVEKYQNENLTESKGIVFIVIKHRDINKKEISEYRISSHIKISSIYSWPITTYIVHNERPVFIYYENGPYVNPRNYPLHIVKNEFQKYLMNDFFMYYDSKTKEVIDPYTALLFHPKRWHYKDGKLHFELIGEPSLSKIIFNQEAFNYQHLDNLDNFRTDYSELKFID